jgi:predicted nicotinamide N-methyase
MSKYLEAHVQGLLGKACLELGAGTGLVSIVAWLLGAGQVLATDLAGPHLEHIQRNTSTNTTRIALERKQALPKEGGKAQLPIQQHHQERDSTVSSRKWHDMLRTIELKGENLHVAPLDW